MVKRAIVVDDEPLARRALQRLLRKHEWLEVVAECEGGTEALERIRQEQPDLVFLDIEMPDMSGVEVVRRLSEGEPAEPMPLIVFTTAHDRHAVAAFEEGALDYVLKPVDEKRLQRTLQRAQRRLDRATGEARRASAAGAASELGPPVSGEVWMRLLERLAGPVRYRDRFVAREGQRLQVIEAEQIDWIEARNNHVALHVGDTTHLLRETMGTISAQLDPKHFIRVKRSAIVNVRRVKSLEPWNYNEFVLFLTNGTKITTGRTYREQIRQAFGC